MCKITLTISNCLKKANLHETVEQDTEVAYWKAKYESEHEARLKAEAENNCLKNHLNIKPGIKRFTVRQMAIFAHAICKKAGVLPKNKKNITPLFSGLTGFSSNTLGQNLCSIYKDEEIEMLAARIEPEMPELAEYMRNEKFYLPEITK